MYLYEITEKRNLKREKVKIKTRTNVIVYFDLQMTTVVCSSI